MDTCRWAAQIAEWKPHWQAQVARKAGRPKRRWSDDITSFLSSSLPTSASIRLIEEHRSQQQAVLDEFRHSEELLRNAVLSGKYADELHEILATSGSTSAQRKKQLTTFYLTLRHGVRILEARLGWCEEAIAQLRGQSVRQKPS